jgi:prevent-host-death family protein
LKYIQGADGPPHDVRTSTTPLIHPTEEMYTTQGIEAIATVTELRSKTSALMDQAKGLKTGIMIQKNNRPEAVLLDYDLYQKMHKSYFKK